MGIYRTLSTAQAEHPPAPSWQAKVIVKVTLKDGRTFYRTATFDQYRDKCKRCRKVRHGAQGRLPCSGRTCETCGNPFAAYTRELRRKGQGGYYTVRYAWTERGRGH